MCSLRSHSQEVAELSSSLRPALGFLGAEPHSRLASSLPPRELSSSCELELRAEVGSRWGSWSLATSGTQRWGALAGKGW